MPNAGLQGLIRPHAILWSFSVTDITTFAPCQLLFLSTIVSPRNYVYSSEVNLAISFAS